MAVRSGFFNSIDGDRKYQAGRFAEYFATFIGNGVFPNPSTGLQVIANDDMTVTVKPGKGWINGYTVVNDDDYILQLDPADGVLSRIDRIVARYDVVDREIRLEIKKGTFASAPEALGLQRDADAYELGLADIAVNNGAISISQANITDLRLNTDLCGVVHGTVDQVDTSTLFDQYLSWYQQRQSEYAADITTWIGARQAEYTNWYNTTTSDAEQDIADVKQDFDSEFNNWFDDIKEILNENAVGNLLILIGDNTDAVADIDGKIDAHLAESMPHQFIDGGKIYRWGFRTVDGQPQFICEEV